MQKEEHSSLIRDVSSDHVDSTGGQSQRHLRVDESVFQDGHLLGVFAVRVVDGGVVDGGVEGCVDSGVAGGDVDVFDFSF